MTAIVPKAHLSSSMTVRTTVIGVMALRMYLAPVQVSKDLGEMALASSWVLPFLLLSDTSLRLQPYARATFTSHA